MINARIGEISHGTLRTEDLLQTFSAELAYHVRRNLTALPLPDVERMRTLIAEGEACEDFDSEAAADLLHEISDELEQFAPAYCYFGANEGDGSSFGFWPSWCALEELPRVSDPAEVEGMGEDCVFVNDHGNMTVYAADGTVIFDCV